MESSAFAKMSSDLQIIIEQLSSMVSDNKFITETMKLAMQEINDGFCLNESGLCSMFENMARIKDSSFKKAYSLCALPITESIAGYKAPVILISDENELDTSTQIIAQKRAENGYLTFPVIVFTDEFFQLAYGEKLSYKQIIKTFEDSIKTLVMTFLKSDFSSFELYVNCVISICKIDKCLNAIGDTNSYLKSYIDDLESATELSTDCIKALITTNEIKAICLFLTELHRLENKLHEQEAYWNGEIKKLREINDAKVVELHLNREAKKLSPFAVNIDLEYGKLPDYINSFLNNTVDFDAFDYDVLSETVKDIVEKTRDQIEHNNANLSIIGTFSSGKTTLINTFLGSREVPLRTSMAHNTAVLMHLFYEPTNKEYYIVKYKKRLIWTIVKPASMDTVFVNKYGEKIRIVSVKSNQSEYEIFFSIIRTREIKKIRIRSTNGLAIKNGDVLNPGEPFTKNGQFVSQNVEICSKSELELLIKLIAEKDTHAKITTMSNNLDTNQNDKIINFLKKIRKVAGETSKAIPYSTLCEALNISPVYPSSVIQPESASFHLTPSPKKEYPSYYKRVEVECSLNKAEERRDLNHTGWVELCGDPAQNTKILAPAFCEKPECYMLASELRLNINSEFLQYCSLTDTPGFGSITEEHDAITERYIRDNSGRLLVMIAVNAKTLDAKYQDLINDIDNIYNNYKSQDKQNVIFILNVFTNIVSNEIVQKKNIDAVASMLISYGFSRKNIFVCDLKKALIDRQEKEMMLGFPSYKCFHDYLINEMISADLTKKYKQINLDWNVFFQDSISVLDNQLHTLRSALKDCNSQKEIVNNNISMISKVSYDVICGSAIDEINSSFRTWESLLISAYRDKPKGIVNHYRYDAIISSIDQVMKDRELHNEAVGDDIEGYYELRLLKIGEMSLHDVPKLPTREENLLVIDILRLKNLMIEADEETPRLFGKSDQLEKYSKKIRDVINDAKEQSLKKARDYCENCFTVVEKYKKEILKEQENILSTLGDEAQINNKMEKIKNIKKKIDEIKRKFQSINFDI